MLNQSKTLVCYLILTDNVITSNSVGILVFFKTDLINFGEIKHAILIIQPT